MAKMEKMFLAIRFLSPPVSHLTRQFLIRPSLFNPIQKRNFTSCIISTRSSLVFPCRSFSSTPQLTEDLYRKFADRTMDQLEDQLNEIDNLDKEIPGFDLQYSNGVLTLKLGSKGTYVINKQPPNKQIWLSSPVSGPCRYDYDFNSHQWKYHRTNEALSELLSRELTKLLGEKFEVKLNAEN